MARKRPSEERENNPEQEKKSSQRKKKRENAYTKVVITALNQEQKELIKTIESNTIIFVKGAPGTGKTFVSVALGLHGLLNDKYKTLILSRPVIEVEGEKLGFLPGNADSKVSPFMMPIFCSLEKLISADVLKKLIDKNGVRPRIKILPIAHMRGYTIENSFIVVDEAQNMKINQMRMLLTRLGNNAKMVICGDIEQSDIKRTNGLEDAFERLQDIEKIGFVSLSEEAIVRSELIKVIENRYRSSVNKQFIKHT